ncbi:MAG TPA: cytochrome ubiquinol oxidase subunit I [Xanthomonadales bacterium]|nr:cytochrome ubiquinol oxidase subunit I [Xanthomonadales bacterium]
MLDALLLSRIQFAFVITFHILFPAFTIGLACWLAFLEGNYLRTRDAIWRDLYFFWLRIFAVSFGMGVVSGIVMSFQFGTNWARLSIAAGNILGPLLSYEVLTAFFLEATFLGVMLFGWTRVSPRVHFVSTLMVALGTLISTFWIISANSWMQTPAGFELIDGVFHPADWWAVIFNPSFPYRLAHMVLAAFLTTAFVIGGVSAHYLRRNRFPAKAERMLKLSIAFVAIAAPLQILAGDLHGLNVRDHQPAKLAAIEGHWEGGRGVPFVVFALPDQKAERNRWELAIPKLGSLILTHSLDGEVQGLKDFPRDERPPVAIVFWSFRVMVAIGMLMLAIAALGLLWWRGLAARPAYLRWWTLMIPSGFVALVAGWWTAEVGRQPWVVYGLLRTADAHSEIGAGSVLASLATFAVAYAIVFGAGIWYLLKLLRKGPVEIETQPPRRDPPSEPPKRPARPLSVPEQPVDSP